MTDAMDQGHLVQGRIMHVSRLATIGEMAAGVAHEINQPLTAIATYAQACTRLLQMADPNLGEVREALQEIASQAVRAGAIIRRVRNLVRSDQSERAPARVNDLIEEIRELVQADARAHDARLQFELASDLPTATVDGVQIQHVLLNLLRNAFEALTEVAPQERKVVIRTERTEDGEIEISVSDSGGGITPAVAARMYDPFYTTKVAGTGLGLPISSTIVRTHKGVLGHRDNRPRGVTFFVRLPVP